MEEIEAVWIKVPELMKVSLSFVPPGKAFEDFETYAEDVTEPGTQTFNEPSPSQNIILGTSALGVHCLFQDRIHDKPRSLLVAKVFLEANLQHTFGIQEGQKSTCISDQSTSDQNMTQARDGRDP